MRLCVVSFKECWRDEAGRWMSSGGFPLQIGAISTLFARTTIVVCGVPPRSGGVPLPADARVVAMRPPAGADLRRKLSVVARLPYYLGVIARHVGRADVVHTPLPGDLPLLALVVGVALRKRVIARYGGSWMDNPQTTAVDRLVKRTMRRLAGGRHVMLTTGEGTTPPAPGVSWIFSTALSRAELDSIRADATRPLGRPPRLVYVGRLSPEKGVADLLRAFARLIGRDGPAASLTVIGDGPERAALEALARALGIAARVRFAGQLDRPALSAELASADVCVQPSLTEGFSKAWLDAMAHGLPVLSTDVGAARTVIGAGADRRGWVVAPGDPAALEERLRGVLSDPADWPALRRRCRAYVEDRTLEAWARAIDARCAEQWGGAQASPRSA